MSRTAPQGKGRSIGEPPMMLCITTCEERFMNGKVNKGFALLFAEGIRLIECRMVESRDELPAVESRIELFERDTHTRATERCTRPCCAVEPKTSYSVVSLTAKGAGWDGLTNAAADREWFESQCTLHDWCNLFDSYSLAGYLRLDCVDDPMPEEVIIVEVRRGLAG